MNKLGIGADCNNFSACLFEGSILLCQSSKFCCSDKGKIRGIKEEDGPLFCGFLASQADFAEISFRRVKCFELEIGNGLANLEAAAIVF